jgi:hypothetical protein
MGYILQLGVAPNTYLGFRCATPEMDCYDGEIYIDTLEGWEQVAPPPPPPTPLEKREQLIQLFAQQPLAVRAAYSGVAANIYTALGSHDVELALYWLNEAAQLPTTDATLIATMVQVLEG